MEITKSDIKKLIEVEKRDTFSNHLITILLRDYRAKGEIKSSELRLWSQSSMTGITYPIFIFKLNTRNQLVKIEDKLNPVGRAFSIFFLVFLIFLFTPSDINNINWSGYWPLFLTSIIFMGVVIFVGKKYYHFEKKNQLNEILELLEVEVENKPENEWSRTNIFIRLLLYPLCFFIIALNIFVIIPAGKYGLTIGSLGFVGIYLYTDLKALFGKKTTGNIG